MGPRLVGRGKISAKHTQEAVPHASMGPRLVGRGKTALHSGPLLSLI